MFQNHFSLLCPKVLISSVKWHGPFCPLKAFCLITFSVTWYFVRVFVHALESQLTVTVNMSLHLSQEIAVDISADAIPLKRAPVPGNPADASEWRRLT